MYSDFTTHQLLRLAAFFAILTECASPAFSLASEVQGFTEPYRDIDVAAAEMGIVEAIHVKEGDRVKENQVLIQMDAAILELTLKIAQSIKESQGKLESAKEQLELQTKTVSKLKVLRSRQHASHQEVERAETQERIAEADLRAVQEELEVKTLEFERARLQLERRRLRSPIDGIVTRIMKDCGESVMPNDSVLVKVVKLDPLLAVFLVPAEQAYRLKAEETVDVKIDDITKMTQGTIEFVSPTADPQSGLTRVRVRIPNPDERLPCGVICFLMLDGASSAQLANTGH